MSEVSSDGPAGMEAMKSFNKYMLGSVLECFNKMADKIQSRKNTQSGEKA